MAAVLTWLGSVKKLPGSISAGRNQPLLGPCSFPRPLLPLSVAFVFAIKLVVCFMGSFLSSALLSNIWHERGTQWEGQMGNYLNLLLTSHSSSALPSCPLRPHPTGPPNPKHCHLPFGPLGS